MFWSVKLLNLRRTFRLHTCVYTEDLDAGKWTNDAGVEGDYVGDGGDGDANSGL